MLDCIGFLLTAQMLFALASEHHEAGRVISEYNEVQRAVWYSKQYRLCVLKESNLLKELTLAIKKQDLGSLPEVKRLLEEALYGSKANS